MSELEYSFQEAKVLAVVVTYLPAVTTLSNLLLELANQCFRVLVVDNTPREDDRVHAAILSIGADAYSVCSLARLGDNLGIAAALNVGIEVAVSSRFDYVLFSDQDSVPSTDMMPQLLSVAKKLSAMGVKVGCVSPAYLDQVTGQIFSFQVQHPGHFFYSTFDAMSADPWVEVITSITSGSLIPCEVFATVGTMREDYFIDSVDIEWCHRARYHGYKLYGTSRATMGHHLGDDAFFVWYLRWRLFGRYSPLRLYYRFRNFILLSRSSYVPWRWKLRASWYYLGNIYAFLLFSPDKRANFKFILRGVIDGIRGRGGPYSE